MYRVRNVPDMAFRTWGRLLLTALGVSVLAGAGQLGVAYGFGIVRLTGAFTGTTVNQWPAQLVWVGWFAANAAVVGAVLTGRLAHRDAPAASTGRQLAIGGAAALGATIIAPLCMQPARAAELISVDPVWAVGICAVLGAVIGAGAAIAVLLRPELGWNMAAVAGAVWLLALISVLPSLGATGTLPTARLGVLEPSWLNDAAAQRLALLLLPTVALLAGAATAGLARRRGQAPLVSGATGVAGPVLVAFAYLTAGPGDAVDRYQAAPYYGSLIAILAGALGAAAAALLRWPAGAHTADPQAIEPTDILRALPAGPALPGAESAKSANDRDTAEPAGAQLANTDRSAGKPADVELVGAAPAPWAAGGPDGVRTVPAHWDWPATTASGQHGPTPAAPATPAAWMTDPTGEFTAGTKTSTSSRDDATSRTDTEPSATTEPLATTEPSASTTAGRADAATPTGGPGDDEPTSSATTATTDSATTVTTDSATTATSGRPTGDRTISNDTASAVTTSTGTASTGTADPGTAEAPLTPKPRRTRKPKAVPGAAISNAPDGTPPSESEATAEPTTGRTRKTTRPGRSANSTDSGEATHTPAPSRKRQGTGPGLTTESIPPATSGTPTAAADPTTPAATTDSTGAPAEPTVTTGPMTKAADSRTPATATTGPTAGQADASTTGPKAGQADAATTGPTAPPAESASDSAAVRAGGTDSAPATEGGSTAGLFGVTADSDPAAERWTPAPSAWPVTSAWTAPPQAPDPGSTASEMPTGPDEPTEQTPRPRHRAPLPDLSRAGTWNAFNTARRARPTQSQDSSAVWTAPTGPAAASEPVAPAEHATDAARLRSAATASPVVQEQVGAPSDAVTSTDDPASTDAPSGASTPSKVAEQPSRRGRLGGLFRRNRSRGDEEGQETSDATEPLPTQDEEFVDWVAGLSKPVSDNEPEQENGRRSLRSTGRHHRD